MPDEEASISGQLPMNQKKETESRNKEEMHAGTGKSKLKKSSQGNQDAHDHDPSRDRVVVDDTPPASIGRTFNAVVAESSRKVAAARAHVAATGSVPNRTKPVTKIANPTNYDVLFGRGKPYQEHPGNLRLHKCVEFYRPSYAKSRRREKMAIAQTIVRFIKDSRTTPSGRFLRRAELEDYWEEVPDDDAREKVSHALRSKHKYPASASSSLPFEAIPAIGSPPIAADQRILPTSQQQQQQVTTRPATLPMGGGDFPSELLGFDAIAHPRQQSFGASFPTSAAAVARSVPTYPYLPQSPPSSLMGGGAAASFQAHAQPNMLPHSLLATLAAGNSQLFRDIGGTQIGGEIPPFVSRTDPFVLEAILEMRREQQQQQQQQQQGQQQGQQQQQQQQQQLNRENSAHGGSGWPWMNRGNLP